MANAFIFDLDGVMIDNELMWDERKAELHERLFGKKVTKAMGSTIGINMDGIYDRARACGTTVAKEALFYEYYELATEIYSTAPTPDGLDRLAAFLLDSGYKIGIVSASPLAWVTTVTKRLPFENEIELIISLHERPDLSHKPEPDGYNEAMTVLGASPHKTIVLEDSNAGIASAKASGAFVIGLRQNLVSGYEQTGADAYADTIDDVITLVRDHTI